MRRRYTDTPHEQIVEKAVTASAVDESNAIRRSRSTRRLCLVILYMLAAFWGIAQIVSSTNALIYVLFVLLCATVSTHAAIEDSRSLRVQFVHILQVLFFFTWPVASLVYLMVTRGWRGFGWWLLHALGLFAAMCLTFCPTYVLLYWMGMIDPAI